MSLHIFPNLFISTIHSVLEKAHQRFFFPITQKIKIPVLKMFQFISQVLPNGQISFSKLYKFFENRNPTNKQTTMSTTSTQKTKTTQTTRKHQPENQVRTVWTLATCTLLSYSSHIAPSYFFLCTTLIFFFFCSHNPF